MSGGAIIALYHTIINNQNLNNPKPPSKKKVKKPYYSPTSLACDTTLLVITNPGILGSNGISLINSGT